MKKYFIKNSKKMNFISLVIIISGTLILGRYFQIMLFQYPSLEKRYNNLTSTEKIIKKERGRILDCNGHILAESINKYDFWVNTNKAHDKDKIAQLFSDTFGHKKEHYIKKLNNKKNYCSLEKHVDINDAEFILNSSTDIIGLNHDIKASRIYTYSELASQTLGFVNEKNIGNGGIEGRFDIWLDGEEKKIKYKKGSKGQYYIEEDLEQIALDGYNVKLTLDLEMQKILQNNLNKIYLDVEAKSANGIIIEAKTGRIRAIATVPAFNPNEYYKQKYDNKEIDALSRKNTALSDNYEPGSTFKIIPLSLILQKENNFLDSKVYCENGTYKLPNGKILRDHEPHDTLSIEEIMAHSSNIGFSKLSNQFEKNELHTLIAQYGFGISPNILTDNVKAKGFVKPLSQWANIDKHYISIGQGISVTNLQLALSYCLIANGGYLLKPIIVESIYNDEHILFENKPKKIRKVLDSKICDQIILTLEETIRIGTAKNLNLDDYKIAGKTGTAEKWTGTKYEGKYSDSLFVSTFCSIIPSDNPEYVMVISVDEPKYGSHYASQCAVPASKNIYQDIFNNPEFVDLRENVLIKNNLAQKNEFR